MKPSYRFQKPSGSTIQFTQMSLKTFHDGGSKISRRETPAKRETGALSFSKRIIDSHLKSAKQLIVITSKLRRKFFSEGID